MDTTTGPAQSTESAPYEVLHDRLEAIDPAEAPAVAHDIVERLGADLERPLAAGDETN